MEATISKTHLAVLRAIHGDENTSYRKLSRQLKLSQGAIRGTLMELENNKLVTRGGYGRGITRSLTPEGIALLQGSFQEETNKPKVQRQQQSQAGQQQPRGSTQARAQERNREDERPFTPPQQDRNRDIDESDEDEKNWIQSEEERLRRERTALDKELSRLNLRKDLVTAQLNTLEKHNEKA